MATDENEATKDTKANDKPLPKIAVIIDAPGVKACGPYKAGEVYSVEGREAKRLIDVKGFRKATDADKPADSEKSNP